jgi:hypothetical protein
MEISEEFVFYNPVDIKVRCHHLTRNLGGFKDDVLCLAIETHQWTTNRTLHVLFKSISTPALA